MTRDAKNFILSIGLLGPFIIYKAGFFVESWHSFLLGAVVANLLKEAINLIDIRIATWKKARADNASS